MLKIRPAAFLRYLPADRLRTLAEAAAAIAACYAEALVGGMLQ